MQPEKQRPEKQNKKQTRYWTWLKIRRFQSEGDTAEPG